MNMRMKECLKTQMHTGKVEAGIDEVGRGCLAGPVCVAAVILPENFSHILIQDSKKLTEEERNQMYDLIKQKSIAYHILFIEPEIIDDMNILEATMLGMNLCIKDLKVKPDNVLIDGSYFKWKSNVWVDADLDYQFPKVDTVVKGDATYANIAAASILAKVTRDREMCELAHRYPEYHFEKNKGYGTEEHINAIKKYGMTDIHRKSFHLN